MHARILASVLILTTAPALFAQTVAPAYSGSYNITVLGSVPGLPTNYGGIVFKDGDPNTILIGGNANATAGRFYSVPVIRGAGQHITSFGPVTAQGFGANNDGGVAYGPGGVLFYAKYSLTQVGQVKPGSNTDNKVSALGPLGVAQSPGALNFVPPGFSGEGKLKVCSFSGGQFYDVTFVADGTGTYNLSAASLAVTLPGGPEGFIYAPPGSPLFPNPTLLVTEYNAGKVAAYDVDANANPVLASRRDFVTGLTGGEGATIDPVTGDFLFSTFGTSNRVIQVRGFVPPPPVATVTVTSSLNPSVLGQSVTFTATVSGIAPITGTVTFKDRGSDIAGCVDLALVGGSASCMTSGLTVGGHTIGAYYGGNSANGAGNGSVTQSVDPDNYAPVAGPMTAQTFQNQPLSSTLVATDVDGDALTWSLLSLPAHGAAALTNPSTGAFTYTPTAGYSGSDSFTYKVNDSALDSNVATANITVFPVPAVDLPPLPANDQYKTTKNTALHVDPPGVLANDHDPEGAPLSIVSLPVAPPAHGTLQVVPGGGFVYTPALNYVGLDSFQYTVSDGTTTSFAATVVLDVANANFPPVAQDDSYATPGNVELQVGAPGLLGNDSDPDGNQPLRAVIELQPTHGTLQLSAGGGFDYQPNIPPCGTDLTDSFTYSAFDGAAYSANPATVSILIHCTNQAPAANADAFTVASGGTLVVAAPGLLANDSDPDGNVLRPVIVTMPTKGPFAPDASGGFRYIAPTGFSGTDSFTYKVTDGGKESAAATVTITITPVNIPPLAAYDQYHTFKNTTLTVDPPGVLANDVDPDGTLVTAIVVSQPTHGQLQTIYGGGFIYTPTTNFVGLDNFQYQATDGASNSTPATVVIDVANSNAPPVAGNDTFSSPYGAIVDIDTPGLLANDTDPDGNQPLRAVLATQPATGTVQLTSGGGFRYLAPSSDPCGIDQTVNFTYFANDSVVNSIAPATVTLNLNCSNRPPVATADSYATPTGALLDVQPGSGLLRNDSDPDGNAIVALVITLPVHGTLQADADGGFRYLPEPGYQGTDSFTYLTSDGGLESAPVTVTLLVGISTIPALDHLGLAMLALLLASVGVAFVRPR